MKYAVLETNHLPQLMDDTMRREEKSVLWWSLQNMFLFLFFPIGSSISCDEQPTTREGANPLPMNIALDMTVEEDKSAVRGNWKGNKSHSHQVIESGTIFFVNKVRPNAMNYLYEYLDKLDD